MDILLSKTIKPSKLQPQIFSLAKDFAKRKEEDYKVVVSGNNDVMCVVVTPILFARYQNMKDLIEQTMEEIEDEECSKRLSAILKKNKKPKLISGEDVFKKAGLN